MKILGMDNGYNFTKSSKDVCILSTVKRGYDDINNVIQVQIGTNEYVVGESNGEYVADADKLKDQSSREILEVCTLTTIGLSYPGENFIEVSIVAGLPIAYYTKQKEEFKNMLEGLSKKIFINKVGKEQTIKIKQALIYPQSAGLIFKKAQELKEESSLVIDIGGGTWDVSQFNGLKLVEKATYQEGMLILYSRLAQYLNSNYYTKYAAADLYKLIKRGYFTAAGEKQSTDILKSLIENHVRAVMVDIKRDFDLGNVDNVFLIGGGADELSELIKKEHIPNALLEENSQQTNAECFEIMGKMKWN